MIKQEEYFIFACENALHNHGYKKRRATKTVLFTKILKQIEATSSEIKFASETFYLAEAPEIKV